MGFVARLAGVGCAVFAVAYIAVAGITPQEAATRLSGKQNKTWVFVRFETFMGKDDACKKGETWTFSRKTQEAMTGSLTIRRCQDKRVVTAVHPWSILSSGHSELSLDITGDRKYTLLFPAPPKPRQEKMTLRVYSTRNSEPTINRIFTYERD